MGTIFVGLKSVSLQLNTHTMKNLVLMTMLLAFAGAFAACKENDSSTVPVSDCLEQKIKEYKSTPRCGDNDRVVRYDSQIGYVYFFSYEDCCCDFSSPVLDGNCEDVCFFGGIAGIKDCFTDSLKLNLTNPVVIWQQ